MLLLHAGYPLLGTHRPIHLVGVGEEEGREGLHRVAEAINQVQVRQGGHDGGRVGHQLLAYSPRQSVQCTHRGNHESHRCLVARHQAQADVSHRVARAYGIVARFHAPVIFIMLHQRSEALHLAHALYGSQFFAHAIRIVVGVHLYVTYLGAVHLWCQYAVIYHIAGHATRYEQYCHHDSYCQ